MEALRSRLTSGAQSGGHEQQQPQQPQQPESPRPKPPPPASARTVPSQPHGAATAAASQNHKPPRRQHPGRKRLRQQRQSVDSDAPPEEKRAEATPPRMSRASSSSALAAGAPGPLPDPPSGVGISTVASADEPREGAPAKQKRERKPQRPGKYVCSYCGRACAKPSVLQKHIRSHTGERPYPCAPCGFSFKTKSNLYKHRKSHTHKVKAGLATGAEPSVVAEEPATESDDESRQLSSASGMARQASVSFQKSTVTPGESATELPRAMDDSYAVKKRLAMRLSRGKRGPLGSSDEKRSSLIMASRGSTESGYFSRSESTEQSQDSPPNTSAKSYAEIILGKYGRLGHLQPHPQQPTGLEEKSIPFTVPKKQVIDHITKLITINEAVVDTSKIDSVKPRRFSLSRRSSLDSPKGSSLKEPMGTSPPIAGEPGFQGSGSITMGVPCEKFHHQSPSAHPATGHPTSTTAPLLRSHSMPSTDCSTDTPNASLRSFRLSQSFDERQPSETQMSRRYGMLKRQPAIEIPLGAELSKEAELQSSHPLYLHHHTSAVPDHKQCQPQPYECESCGTTCKDWEGYKTHKRSLCLAHRSHESEIAIHRVDHPHLIHHPMRPGSLAMRKRRKEESFEFDDPSSPVATSLPAFSLSAHGREESGTAYERSVPNTWSHVEKETGSSVKVCSVIQHTSSFERQDTLSTDGQGTEDLHPRFPSDEEPQKRPTSQSTPRKLVRQHNVQVPEILVTEDSNTFTESPAIAEPPCIPKQVEEFQWPQRSPSLAQLPIEKLPPKKKRLRLAEAAQSSGESSFDSILFPRSPSQDSSASYASSRSASFEESNKLDLEAAATTTAAATTLASTTTPLRRSRALHMLTVPGVHPHPLREMRRSASEQAPHDPTEQSALIAETMRSKSFDYSCLSPERSAAGWRERRKCLLMRHTAVRDPEEEEQPLVAKHGALQKNTSSRSSPSLETSASPSTSTSPSGATPGALHLSRSPASLLSADAMPCSSTPRNICQTPIPQWKLSQSLQLSRTSEVTSPQSPTHEHLPMAVYSERASISLHPFHPQSSQGPTGAARAHYLPMSTGLKLEIPSNDYREALTRPVQTPLSQPRITLSPETLRPPPVSAAVAVRLHADTLSPACAIYTTLSQTVPARAQEPMCWAPGNRTFLSPTDSYATSNVGSHAWSVEGGGRAACSGGNKRMLSPSNSVDISPESQQQQKRVKEEEEEGEEEEEERSSNKEVSKASSGGHSRLPYLTNVCSLVASQDGPSFPSLQSGTSFSWCYLNYAKPSASTLGEQQPSVYSSWSTSEHDPNPPGLSSKMALSLLQCKQSFSPSIYTMSPMSSSTAEGPEPAHAQMHSTMEPKSAQIERSSTAERPEAAHTLRPCLSEVQDARAGTRNQTGTTEDQQRSAEQRAEEDEEEEKEAQPSSHGRETPRRVCDAGYRSDEEYVRGRGRGRGRGQYMCQECGVRCRKPSALTKHLRLHTSTCTRPHVCKHCSAAFTTKGNLTKHMKSKTHGKKCHEAPVAGCPLDDTETDDGTSALCPGRPETQDEHQHSGPEEPEEDDEDDDNEDEDDDDEESHHDPPRTSTGPERLSCPSDMSREAGSSRDPEPWCRAAPLRCQEALFPHHHQEPGVGTVPSGCQASSLSSPSPALHHPASPPDSPTHGPHLSPHLRHASSPSLSSPHPPLQHVSPSPPTSPHPHLHQATPSPPSPLTPPLPHAFPSPGRPPPPIRPLSPAQAQSAIGGPGHPESPASGLAGPSTVHRTRHPTEPDLRPGPAKNPPLDRTGFASSRGRLQRSRSIREDSPPHQSSEVTSPNLSLLQKASPSQRLSRMTSTPQRPPRATSPPQRSSRAALLSHLPLHSQQATRATSLMIPIGGIHMVQPRTSPLYSLLRRPMPPPTPPAPDELDRSGSAGLSQVPLGGAFLRGAGPGMHTSQWDHRVREEDAGGGAGQSGLLSDRKCMSGVCLGAREASEARPCRSCQGERLSSTHTHAHASTLPPGATHTHITEGSVFPERAQGQNPPPSCQT